VIHPLYYGAWSNADIDAQQKYLKGLAAYMSGEVPLTKCTQPMLWQYTGSGKVKVAAPQRVDSDSKLGKQLSQTDVEKIITSAQNAKILPPFDKKRLLIVFTASGFTLSFCGGPACHRSISNSAFWAAVQADAGAKGCSGSNCGFQLVTAHEIFEAATDPGVNNTQGWNGPGSNDEAVDRCNSKGYPFPTLSSGLQIPSAADNTQGGTCSATGYTVVLVPTVGCGDSRGPGFSGSGGKDWQNTKGSNENPGLPVETRKNIE
jgi:hypothetical protein